MIKEQNAKSSSTYINHKYKQKIIKDNIHLYIMIIPVLLYYLIFAYIPLYGLSFAFRSFEPGGVTKFLFGGHFIGLENFRNVFGDPLFYRALKNTLVISLMKLTIHFPFVVFVSLMLNELRMKRFKKITQTIMYLPHFFSWVVISGIIIQLTSINGGVISTLIAHFNGGKEVSLLTSNSCFRWILLFSTSFKEMGWDTIIYLSALTGISAELYEAANVDGASRFQRIWHITIPGVLPTIMTMLLIKISFMLNGDFDQVYMLYNSSVYEVADIIETYLYRVGLGSGKFGLATSMGLFKSVIGALLLITTNSASKKLVGTGVY